MKKLLFLLLVLSGLFANAQPPIVVAGGNLVSSNPDSALVPGQQIKLSADTTKKFGFAVVGGNLKFADGGVFKSVGSGTNITTNATSQFLDSVYYGNLSTFKQDSLRRLITIYPWGDSFTEGTGSEGQTYQFLFTQKTGISMWGSGGVGGETSTQIRARFMADSAKWRFPTILAIGRNNFSDSNTVYDDIDVCVDSLRSRNNNNFLVIGITNGVFATPESCGTARFQQFTNVNARNKRVYGEKFVDMYEWLMTKGDSSVQDIADVAACIIPASLRSDVLHLNPKGYYWYSEVLTQKLRQFGFVNGSITAPILQAIFDAPPVIGAITPNKINATKTITDTINTKIATVEVENAANTIGGWQVFRGNRTNVVRYGGKMTSGGLFRPNIVVTQNGASNEVMDMDGENGSTKWFVPFEFQDEATLLKNLSITVPNTTPNISRGVFLSNGVTYSQFVLKSNGSSVYRPTWRVGQNSTYYDAISIDPASGVVDLLATNVTGSLGVTVNVNAAGNVNAGGSVNGDYVTSTNSVTAGGDVIAGGSMQSVGNVSTQGRFNAQSAFGGVNLQSSAEIYGDNGEVIINAANSKKVVISGNNGAPVYLNSNTVIDSAGVANPSNEGVRLLVKGQFKAKSRSYLTSLQLDKDSVGYATVSSDIYLVDTTNGLGKRLKLGTGIGINGNTLEVTSQVFGGSISTAVTAVTTFVVSIPTQANNTYQIFVQPTSLAAIDHLFYVTNKTTTSFDIVFKSNVTGTVSFDWILKP